MIYCSRLGCHLLRSATVGSCVFGWIDAFSSLMKDVGHFRDENPKVADNMEKEANSKGEALPNAWLQEGRNKESARWAET